MAWRLGGSGSHLYSWGRSMNIHDPQWWKDSRWHRGLAAEIEALNPRGLAHPYGTPRHPRTARKAARCVEHNHVRRATELTRAIDHLPDPRPAPQYARPRTTEGWIAKRRAMRKNTVSSAFGKLLGSGYYDEYRRAFDAAED